MSSILSFATDLHFRAKAPGPIGLRAGLTSYWIMGEATGATRVDSMGTSNLSDVSGNVTQQITSVLGNFAASFLPLNNTKALRATSAPYVGNASFTLSGWLDWAQTNTTPLISKWGAGNEYILFDPGTGVLIWEAKEAGTLTTKPISLTVPSALFAYITIGYDDTNKQLFSYVNAAAPQTLACNGINVTTEPLTFGNYSESSTGDQSIFQDWGFWRRVLSATEVATLYNGGAGKAFSTF